MHGPSERKPELRETELSIYAIEVLARLSETIDAVEAAYREYQFNTVAQQLYDFVWGDFCDWFVEASEDRYFRRERGAKTIDPDDDGFRSFCHCSTAPSIYAAPDGRAVVVDGFCQRRK